MKYFLQLLCFAFMFGIYLAYEEYYIYMPKHRPPPPNCGQHEIFKICLSNCSNCEQRGNCILKDCNSNGCDCVPSFVRLTPGGPCEPISKCPQPQCGENEVFRECGPMCERCGIFNCKMVHCEHRCYCKQGYLRDADGKCIPENECPPRTQCVWEEEWRDSGFEDEYCLHEDGEIVSNATVNVTRCHCKEGFRRNGLGHCINETFCDVVRCSGPERYQNCVRKCNATCRSYGDPDCVEDGQCYPGCFCPEGMYMNDFRLCVTLEQCPPDSNPYMPTRAPQEETTIPASVGGDLQQNESTTPAAGGDEESEKSADSEATAVAEATSGDGAELPENLHGEDIESTEKTSPKRKPTKRQKNRVSAFASGGDASVKAEAEAALEAIRGAGGKEK